jgi:hypothetical protein
MNQQIGPRNPRHRCAGDGFQDLLKWQNGARVRHKRLGSRQSLPPSPTYCPVRPSLNTQLTSNVQIVAGVISLLNDYQISQGKPPLGFLNPWLYGKGLKGLRDIIYGSNPGCKTNGFYATVGWDPVRPTSLVCIHFLRLLTLGLYRSQVLGSLTLNTCNTYLI